MKLEQTGIPGCVLISGDAFEDQRGRFVKSFHAPSFEALGLRTDWREEYYTSSRVGVLRGMHFQQPPAQHVKLVSCMAGSVVDVILDLRLHSPTFGQATSVELQPASAIAVYVPEGCAHGFLAMSEDSVLHYKVTSVHAPEHDTGIAWDGFGFDWPIQDPVLSARDQTHPSLADFDTPFTAWNGG